MWYLETGSAAVLWTTPFLSFERDTLSAQAGDTRVTLPPDGSQRLSYFV
jgi:hypothetical protein